ncbi:signal recognition particle receptor subunit alpha [Plasmodium brasilianum]|uniref:Signal recognition particle receptor alpha subunit, putative n=2 Tax=Plasmodium (Plasmodium) TaxID=418103 RepID=A0A1A8X8L5_PLAMA|nr:signal recognition particle receptor alpha subunit, putative [Plasmodium malariae]KAI4837065.1 signal recognition particle receptor subunit alpha [Plasmodium brasilianum]SBT01585.1 signal recognition particle receptor alpha subunit, putative [Plasmodium malariae]SCO92945.1 signal recognition particle receptor alpha subunit, putative [Plasmodium malariae]
MIDVVNIFSKGGVILWSYSFYEIDDETIRTIVKYVLIEEKYDEFSKKYNKYHAKWKLLNDMDIVILIIYQGIQNSAYLDNLFIKIKKTFIKLLPKNLDYFNVDLPLNFDRLFLKIVEDMDKNVVNVNMNSSGKNKQSKGNKSRKKNDKSGTTSRSNRNDRSDESDTTDLSEDENYDKKIKGQGDEEEEEEKKLLLNGEDKSYSNNKKKSKIKKTAREWELNQKITKKDIEKLDYSKNEENINHYNDKNKQYAEGDFEDSSDCTSDTKNNILNKLNDSFLKVFSYNSKIEEEDIETILEGIKNKLLSKNVAVGICDTLINRMKENLIGKRKTLFAMNVKKTVSTVLSDTIQSILTPKDSVDVLRAALEAKSLGQLYSIVFLGVNGVGKSTNLAKVCYYLKNKGNLKIIIAACDTFRAGAVEQLRIHANCLNVFLYEKGYGKDAAAIAKEAILYAKKENYDVILIDTAGRMQDNEPLMRSLGKLILINNPNLILFVGEALVGNDAIDQLKKFNQALMDATCNTNKRTIDGIILTKFDTVDDKVGTALSMVYLTGKPIVFVGVGQKYTHLKKFNVNMVVKALS